MRGHTSSLVPGGPTGRGPKWEKGKRSRLGGRMGGCVVGGAVPGRGAGLTPQATCMSGPGAAVPQGHSLILVKMQTDPRKGTSTETNARRRGGPGKGAGPSTGGHQGHQDWTMAVAVSRRKLPTRNCTVP